MDIVDKRLPSENTHCIGFVTVIVKIETIKFSLFISTLVGYIIDNISKINYREINSSVITL